MPKMLLKCHGKFSVCKYKMPPVFWFPFNLFNKREVQTSREKELREWVAVNSRSRSLHSLGFLWRCKIGGFGFWSALCIPLPVCSGEACPPSASSRKPSWPLPPLPGIPRVPAVLTAFLPRHPPRLDWGLWVASALALNIPRSIAKLI